jgi:hypothetical protein
MPVYCTQNIYLVPHRESTVFNLETLDGSWIRKEWLFIAKITWKHTALSERDAELLMSDMAIYKTIV